MKKVLVTLLCLLIAIPILYVGFLYVSYVDKTITSGSAYGFTIGQTKTDAYRTAQAQFRAGDITAINTRGSRDQELKQFPQLNADNPYRKVSEVRDWFANWDQWSLWSRADAASPLAVLEFHGDRLTEVWQPPGAAELGFRVGQSYSEAYALLESIAGMPEHSSLVVATGWMARRQPASFDDSEYRLVADQNEWTLLVADNYFNTVRLSFDEGRLSRIYRHRQYFELP